MTKKDIEFRIRFEANSISVPDVRQQILAQVPNRKVVVKEEKKRFSFAARFSYVLTILVVVFISILLFTNNSGKTNPTTLTKNVGDAEKLYAKQIVTLAGFADTVKVDNNIELQSTLFLSSNQTDYSDVKDKINEYFNAVSTLLSQDSAEYEIIELKNSKYSYKLTVKYKVLNDTIETVIYYNEKPDPESDDEDLDEIATDLDGKVEYNGKEYSFIGKKMIEKDEIEAEFILEIDKNNYLKVSHEYEEDEKELKYEFFDFKPNDNDDDDERKPYKEVNIKVDEEDKKVVINSREHEDEFEFDFTFNKEEDRDNVKVSYKHGNEKHENITIDDDEDDYRYDFTPDDDEDDYYFGNKPHGHGRPGDKEHHGPDHD